MKISPLLYSKQQSLFYHFIYIDIYYYQIVDVNSKVGLPTLLLVTRAFIRNLLSGGSISENASMHYG